jgi:predicted transcriptional regulator
MSSRTSIQLDREAKMLLERLKEEMGAKNYSEVVKRLGVEAKRLKESELGSLPKLKTFEREKLDRLD